MAGVRHARRMEAGAVTVTQLSAASGIEVGLTTDRLGTATRYARRT
jgi:hypothetical protein